MSAVPGPSPRGRRLPGSVGARGVPLIEGIGRAIPRWGRGDAPLFAGPIIAREVLTAPRPPRFYVARAAYAGLLFILMWTAWQALVGWREVREIGTLARFGGIIFHVFVLLPLKRI